MDAKAKIAVVGAGPGGLSAGIALHQAGFDVTVYERHDKLRPLGGAILLNAIGIFILRRYGAEVDDIRPVDRMLFKRFDGHLRATVSADPALSRQAGVEGWITGMMRSDLYKRLLSVAPEGLIETGRELVGVDDRGDGAVLRFADGSTAEAQLVVGADGINSVVRRELWGESELKNVGIDVWLGWNAESDLPRDEIVLRHNTYIQLGYAPLVYEGRPCVEWWCVEPCRDSAPENPKQHIQDHIRDFEKPARDLVASTDPDHLFRWVIQWRDPLDRWSKGRMTLLGDACHPTSPYAGYGAGMAIEDGYFLAQCLKGVDLDDLVQVTAAFDDFEDQRLAYTNQVTEFARTLSRGWHQANRPVQILRDFLLDHTRIPERKIVDGYQKEAHALLQSLVEAEG